MILRDYCVYWIIGWVACWIAFMSVFFTLEKLVLKSGSTPLRHLSVCRAFQAFSYRNPDTSSTPGGSIEKAFASSIASRHLVDRSSFCSWIWCVVPWYLLYTLAVDYHFLDTYLDSFLNTFRHLHLSSFTEGLYIHSSWSDSHFFDLSRSIRTYSSPKHILSLTPNLFLCDFSSFFKILLLLVSF